MAHEPFNRMYFVEKDEEKAYALRRRLTYVEENLPDEVVCDNYRIVTENVNQVMDEIIEEIAEETLYQSERVNTLSFVDNQGMDVHFSTIKTLTRIYGDLLINFPTTAVRRTAGAEYDTKLNKFYGDDGWRAAVNTDQIDDDALRSIYMSNLAEQGRPEQEFIPVQSGGSYFYDMIYCTRETAGGSPYVDSMSYMKDKIDQLTGDDVERVLRFMRGEQTGLDLFQEQDDDGQTGLGDFL